MHSRILSCVGGAIVACSLGPAAIGSQPEARAADLPRWLIFEPNYRSDEAGALAVAAMRECTKRYDRGAAGDKLHEYMEGTGLPIAAASSDPELARRIAESQRVQDGWTKCVDASPGIRESAAIRERAPTEFILPVRSEPRSSSTRLGEIRIRTRPPSAQQPHLVTYRAEGAADRPLELDDMTSDGFYGRLAHTVLDVRGDWIQLPANPFPSPVWINWRETFRSAAVFESLTDQVHTVRNAVLVKADGSLEFHQSANIMFLSRSEHGWTVRLEDPSDMACGQEAPRFDESKAIRYFLSTSQVQDANGHITAAITHWKGC